MAFQAIERAQEIEPDLPRAQVALGHYYYWGPRDYERALEALGKAEVSLPNDPDVLASIAYIRRRQGHAEEALERLKKAVELDPRDVQKSQALGTTLIYLGRYEEADRQFGQALKLAPDAMAPAVWRSHNWILWKGDGRGALELLNSVLPGEVPDFAKFNQVFYLSFERDHEEALTILDSMEEEFYPNQFQANSVSLERAYHLQALGRTDEAFAAAAKAAEALEQQVLENPNDPRMHGSLGRAYALLGREQEALRESERAVKLQPVEMDAMEGSARLWELSMTHASLGNAEETLELWDQILETNRSWASVPVLEKSFLADFLRDHPGYKELIEKHG